MGAWERRGTEMAGLATLLALVVSLVCSADGRVIDNVLPLVGTGE